MLSNLFSLLWELFIAAPWWLEILIACIVFWGLASVLLILILIIADLLLFLGIPFLFLFEVVKSILDIIIAIFKKIGLPVDSLKKMQQNIDSERKSKEQE